MAEINEDWEQVKKRFEAWWQGEIVDRHLIAVTSPRHGWRDLEKTTDEHKTLDPVEVERQWTDIATMIQRQEKILSRTYFGGEALPLFWHNWSAGHSLYFG